MLLQIDKENKSNFKRRTGMLLPIDEETKSNLKRRMGMLSPIDKEIKSNLKRSIIMENLDEVFVYLASGCSPNPGPGAIGIVVADKQDQYIHLYSKRFGRLTNNQAEYCALVMGLELSSKYTANRVNVYSESELLIKQMDGTFDVNNSNLIALNRRAKLLEERFKEVNYQHFRESFRDHRNLANALKKRAIEGIGINKTKENKNGN